MAERIAQNQWDNEELRQRAQELYLSKIKPKLVRPIESTQQILDPEPLRETLQDPDLLRDFKPLTELPQEDLALPPPPDETEFKSSRPVPIESELQMRIDGLRPESLKAHTAKIITDLVAGVKPVHALRAGLTEDQLMLVWTPLIDAWWNALGDEKRKKFEAAAHQVLNTETDAASERLKAQKVGYRRMLDGIFARNPHMVTEIFDAVKNGREPFCPTGFTEENRVVWYDFLKSEWFSTLSPDEKLRLDAAVKRQKTVPAQIDRKEQELAAKLAQLKKVNSLSGKVALFFNAQQDKGIVHPDFLEREILELRRELIELGVSKFIDDEIAVADARQHEIGDKAGFGARALDATRRLYSWLFSQEKTHAPQSLKGRIFGGLSGAYYNVPGVVERWMLEAGCSHAAGALGDKNGGAKNNETAADLRAHNMSNNEFGRPEVDWTAYALALQHRISIEISRAVQKSQPLKTAVEREPLAGLLKAYKETMVRVAPGLRENQERVNSLLTHLIAETDRDLRARATVRGVPIQHMVAEKDTHWIGAILDEIKTEDENRIIHPTAAGEHAPDSHNTMFKYSVLVGPQQTTERIIREIAAKFDATKSSATLNRDTMQFLTDGWVFDQGDTNPKHLMSNGTENVNLYVGDRVVAVQDDAAPFGFHLKIQRNPPPRREGSVLSDSHGNPEWYYQRTPSKTVFAWRISRDGQMRLAGHFEGKKFVEHREKQWNYLDAHGKERQVGEFTEGVYFKPEGTVVSKNKSSKGASFTEIGKLSERFENTVTIITSDDSEQVIDLNTKNKAYLITPSGKLVEYHASVNQMRELGTLKREA